MNPLLIVTLFIGHFRSFIAPSDGAIKLPPFSGAYIILWLALIASLGGPTLAVNQMVFAGVQLAIWSPLVYVSQLG